MYILSVGKDVQKVCTIHPCFVVAGVYMFIVSISNLASVHAVKRSKQLFQDKKILFFFF